MVLLVILKFLIMPSSPIKSLLRHLTSWILKKKKLTSIKPRKEVILTIIQNIVKSIIQLKKTNKLSKMLKYRNMMKKEVKKDQVMKNMSGQAIIQVNLEMMAFKYTLIAKNKNPLNSISKPSKVPTPQVLQPKLSI